MKALSVNVVYVLVGIFVLLLLASAIVQWLTQ